MIGKAEHLPRGANPRFVVTSLGLEQMAARALYEEVYCARGRHGEPHQGTAVGAIRGSHLGADAAGQPVAPVLRLLRLRAALRRWGLDAVAAALGLRLSKAGTQLARAQCDTIRLKLLKIGVRIRVSVRAVRLSFDEGFPDAGLFGQVLARLQSLPLRC